MYTTEATIFQYLYCTGIIPAVRREVPNRDTCQRTKILNKKYGKLPAKVAE